MLCLLFKDSWFMGHHDIEFASILLYFVCKIQPLSTLMCTDTCQHWR